MAKNMTMTITKNEAGEDILNVACNLTKNFGPSESQKTLIIASSGGHQDVPDRDEQINLTVTRKNPDYVKPGK